MNGTRKELPTRKQDTSLRDPLSVSITDAIRNVEPGSELDRVIQRWKGFNFTVKKDEQWLLEGFVNLFQNAYEIARTIDPSLPPQLPPQCFDTEEIAKLFRLSANAFAGYHQKRRGVRMRSCGPPRRPGRTRKLQWIADFIHERIGRLCMREISEEFLKEFPNENSDEDRLKKIYRRYYRNSP